MELFHHIRPILADFSCRLQKLKCVTLAVFLLYLEHLLLSLEIGKSNMVHLTNTRQGMPLMIVSVEHPNSKNWSEFWKAAGKL